MAKAARSFVLECPVCQEQFSDPRVLPCKHVFCLRCLEKVLEHQRSKESIPCPVCRATYHLLTAGIHGLPKNKQLCTLDTDKCSRPATVYCDVCDVCMCEQCELSHKNREHKTTTITQPECKVTDEVDKETTVTGQSVTRGDRGVRQLNTFLIQCNSEVRGMQSYHNYLFIVHNDHAKLYVYDERGRLKRSVQIHCQKSKRKMTSPCGMSLVRGERDTHYLVIGDSQCLWWLATVKQAGDVKLGQPIQHKPYYTLCGISTDRSGRVVVADYGSSRVYVYSDPGQEVTCLQLSHNWALWQVLAGQSGGYVVSYGLFGELSWVNSGGHVTRHYSDRPSVHAHHTVDDGCDLLVSDPDHHCVHIVTREGRHDGHLITDIDPTCVCLDPAGHRLWVAYKGNDNNRHVIEMAYTTRS